MDLHTIGLIYNPHVEASRVLGEEILAWLIAHGMRAWLCAGQENVPIYEHERADLFITLGGDGTILRAMQSAAPSGIPVFGINLGRVGFLTELSPEVWEEGLTRVLAGDGWIETRMMLRVTLQLAFFGCILTSLLICESIFDINSFSFIRSCQ